MRYALLALACACGGKAEPPPIVPKPIPKEQQICTRFGQLVAEQCGNFARMAITDAQCPELFKMALDEPNTKDGRVLAAMGDCMIGHPTCQGVSLCIATIQFDDPHDLRACSDLPDSRAVGIDKQAWQARGGANVTRLSEARSSKDAPIETCGIAAGLDWLVAATCADGSHPIATRDAGEAARVGNVGRGGKCGSIVDQYRVACPEAAYDVFIDGYVCPH